MSDLQWQFLGTPVDARSRFCDWCGTTAAEAFELYDGPRKKVGTAQYVYACSDHLDVAARMVAARNGK